MYDFYFGTKDEIENDPKKFLLSIKRMLPRWCNSIPDSEYLALYEILSDMKFPRNPVFVETGSGASTIVLCYMAVKTNGELYTWDTNGSKLFYMRSVLNDTVMRHYTDKNLANHWKYVAYTSTADSAGIGILEEMGKKVNACFFDSEHVLDVLKKELIMTHKILDKESIVAIDDGNYSYVHTNTAYLNMVRKKQGLGPVGDAPGNVGKPFWKEVENYLMENSRKVEYLKDNYYKKNYQGDLFWPYFRNDRDVMSKLDMEKTEDLEHRFDAWKVYK